MSILSRLFDAPDEVRAFTRSDAIPKNSEGYWTEAGEHVNDQTALRLAAVYACVRLLADSVASLPFDAYRKKGTVREEISPPPSLIKKPSAQLENFEFIFQSVSSLALRGNSFHLINKRDAFEYPIEMEPVHPDCVRVGLDEKTGLATYAIDGTIVPRYDIVHIRRFSLPGSVVGLSPIQQAQVGIGLGLAAEKFGARWFGQSATPSSVLETDQNLDAEQARRLQKSWISSHGGKRHPAVLSGGVKWKAIEVTPEESQFLETRAFQRGEIAMLFGVPPHMIGDTEKSTSWGSGIEQQSIGFVTYTLRPWLTCIESALSALLPRGQFVKFNVSALLRGDTPARYEAYNTGRLGGWLSVNEIRALEDMPPIGPEGDTYIQPLNMAPLGSEDPGPQDPTHDPDQPDQPKEEPSDDDV
ncbi:phage portal protein [Nocardia sp. NPDC058519]|uniref:phage portal protein n=1 Tax=Nocardia sp. NPDC058519 TaxID=3346535 RepID=UPI00365036A5